MKRFVALATVAVVAFALASVLTATAALEDNSKAQSTPIHTPPPRSCTAATFKAFSAKVWSRGNWKRGKPKKTTITAKGKRLHCAPSASHRKAMARTWRTDKLRYGRYRALRLIAPYPGGGTWWAIPYYIVYCESRGEWLAYNPSGAAGPYQLMPEHGAPYPATTWHEKMSVHRTAAALYAGGTGASNWVCA
jgi:hypothetical protein